MRTITKEVAALLRERGYDAWHGQYPESVTRTLNTTMQWSERSLWLGSDAAHTQIPPLKRSEVDCAG